MKCIKSIKPLKNTEVGTINRINDVEAEVKVLSGYWKYIPKSEWKSATRKSKPEVVEVSEETISEKQLKHKKNVKDRSK